MAGKGPRSMATPRSICMVVPGEGSEWTARQDERAKATPLGQRCLAMDVQRLPVLVVSVDVWCVCGLWGVS